MSIDLITSTARKHNMDLLSFLDAVDQSPDEFPVEIQHAVKDFLFRGNKMFAPVGLTDEQYERRAENRVAHFNV